MGRSFLRGWSVGGDFRGVCWYYTVLQELPALWQRSSDKGLTIRSRTKHANYNNALIRKKKSVFGFEG